MNTLKELRQQVDKIDEQIVALLSERMLATDQIGTLKEGLDIVDHGREKTVFAQVANQVHHPVLKSHIIHIYETILQGSKMAQQFFQYKILPFKQVGVIGLGLIGGSICKGLKEKNPLIEIVTLKHPEDNHAEALAEKHVDKEYESLEDVVAHAELVILASPISTIIPYAKKIKDCAGESKQLLVIDVASVKGAITESFEELSSDKIEFLGSHPMSGKERSGFNQSEPMLFVGKPWMITPHSKTTDEAVEVTKSLIRFLGSEPKMIDAQEHDQKIALVSHLPMILSACYLDFVRNMDPNSLTLSGPGFASFTRLGVEKNRLLAEIVDNNHDHIIDYLRFFIKQLASHMEGAK